MASRPYLESSIDDLEKLFEDNEDNSEVLKKLQNELLNRKTKRAKALLQEVSKRLDVLTSSSSQESKNETSKTNLKENSASPINNEISANAIQEKPPQKDIVYPDIKNQPKDILSAWIALEALQPSTFKKTEELAANQDRKLVFPLNDKPLPWTDGISRGRKNYRLFYHVILGTIDFQKSIEKLLQVYSDKREERPVGKGEAVIASFIVDSQGIFVDTPGSVALSSFAWGLNLALESSLKELDLWDSVQEAAVLKLKEILSPHDTDGNPVPVGKSHIETAYDFLVGSFKIPNDVLKKPYFSILDYVYYKEDEPEALLLNSFFLKDLIKAKTLFGENKAPQNLKLYLGADKPSARVDMLADPMVLERAVNPTLMPFAKWPCRGKHPLVLLQQAAVNIAMSDLKDEGIVAVNGPPGTGKTTLLRDIYAAVLVERAKAMLEFSDPEHAFQHSGEKVKAGNGWLHLYKLSSKLKGYEMIIASSNNKAVENVSMELPHSKAVDDDYGDFGYFKPLSDTLLGDDDTWGLAATVMGNAKNLAAFIKTFWWDEDVCMRKYLAHASGTPQIFNIMDENQKIIGTRLPKIISEAAAPRSKEQALSRWYSAKKEFQSTHNSIVQKINELEKARRENIFLDKHGPKITSLFELKEDLLKSHDMDKPFLYGLRLLFNSKIAKAWENKYHELLNKYNSYKEIYADIYGSDSTPKQLTHSEILKTQYFTRNAIESVSRLKKILGASFIDKDLYEKEHNEKHLLAPWHDTALSELRDELFFSSLRLHKAFIDAAAKPIRHNVAVLMQNLFRVNLANQKQMDLLPDLWSSFFIITPAISTTFASCHKMFGALPENALGWLLVDEAGQALPQAAVGALRVTKKAVVVGDPIQIEPVVTLPDSLTMNICRMFGVDPNTYNAPTASVQTLADASSPYFAEFATDYSSRTVGIPLLTHRRCSNPMFHISNRVAYSGLMVHAKKEMPSKVKDCLGSSCWIDIKGSSFDKWCPEEGNKVIELLTTLKNSGIRSDSIYIVSPFRIVAENLRKTVSNHPIHHEWIQDISKWQYERIGTVHTVQGREAEAVIFVLGAPDVSQKGARIWAGSQPNLLNVAVTRAKEALYVIGNRDLWKEAGLFKVLDGML